MRPRNASTSRSRSPLLVNPSSHASSVTKTDSSAHVSSTGTSARGGTAVAVALIRCKLLYQSRKAEVVPRFSSLPSCRLLTQPRIKRVAQTAAHQVHRQRGHVDHQPGDDHVADVGAEELLRI